MPFLMLQVLQMKFLLAWLHCGDSKSQEQISQSTTSQHWIQWFSFDINSGLLLTLDKNNLNDRRSVCFPSGGVNGAVTLDVLRAKWGRRRTLDLKQRGSPTSLTEGPLIQEICLYSMWLHSEVIQAAEKQEPLEVNTLQECQPNAQKHKLSFHNITIKPFE